MNQIHDAGVPHGGRTNQPAQPPPTAPWRGQGAESPRPPDSSPWRPVRAYKIAGAVLAAYVAFAVSAQLIGEDQTASGTQLARDNAFCQAIGGYEQALQMLSGQAGNFGDVVIGDSFDLAEFAPAEYEEDARYLLEGLDRASYDELNDPADFEPYLEVHSELKDKTASFCLNVMRQDPGGGDGDNEPFPPAGDS